MFLLWFTFCIFMFTKRKGTSLPYYKDFKTLFELADHRKPFAKYYQTLFCVRRFIIALLLILFEGKPMI